MRSHIPIFIPSPTHQSGVKRTEKGHRRIDMITRGSYPADMNVCPVVDSNLWSPNCTVFLLELQSCVTTALFLFVLFSRCLQLRWRVASTCFSLGKCLWRRSTALGAFLLSVPRGASIESSESAHTFLVMSQRLQGSLLVVTVCSLDIAMN